MAVNGRLDISTLVKVDGWAYLTPNTARAWNAGCNEIVALGYPRPAITAPDGAYRPYQQQVDMKKYWTAQGKPENAATAGTSGHGWATDVDIFKNWLWPHALLVRVFGKYGFTFNVSWEDWHMHQNGLAVASLGPTPIAEVLESGSDMKIISVTGGTIAKVGEFSSEVYTQDWGGQAFSIGVNKKIWGEVTGLTPDEVTTAVNEANARGAAQAAKTAAAVVASLSGASGGASAQEIAAALAPLLVPSIVSAIGTDITVEQVQAATEKAVRAVFADAAIR